MTADRRRMLESELNSRFGEGEEPRFFRAPGRVDIMGSHTDYNEGFILAATVDRDILAAARPRDDGIVNIYSLNSELEVRVHVDHLNYDPEHGWANYVKGVIQELLDLKVGGHGLDLTVHGDIPIGSNLSSSAALEAVAGAAYAGVADAELPPWEMVQAAWRAENRFVGMPCGIMDQFTVIMGAKNAALLLDCRSLDFEKIGFSFKDSTLAVIDSGLGRELVSSKYAERVEECREAVAILREAFPDVRSLRDVTMTQMESARDELGDRLFRRARHVISENERVLAAAEALKALDFPALGKLMDYGHESCRHDYENSTPELDLLAEDVRGLEGVQGVRICGAGWGGCLLALVERFAVETLGKAIREKHRGHAGPIKIWIVETSPGAGPA